MERLKGSSPENYSRYAEKGASLLEFIIIIPVLAFLIAGAYEVSRAVHQYQVIMGIAYEGARSGTQLSPGALRTGCFTDQSMSLAWMDQHENQTGYNEALHDLLRRVRYLFNLHSNDLSLTCDPSYSGFCNSGSGEPAVIAEVISPNPPVGQDCGLRELGRNTLAISIKGMYSPALFPFIKIPVELHSRGFILSNNTTFAPLQTPNPGGSCGGMSWASTLSDNGSVGGLNNVNALGRNSVGVTNNYMPDIGPVGGGPCGSGGFADVLEIY